MDISLEKLKEILVTPGHIDGKLFDNAVEKAKNKNTPLPEELVIEGLITDENLGKTIADFFEYHFVSLHETEIKDVFLEILPEVVARAQHAIVFGSTEETISLATEYVDNYEFFRLLEKKTGKNSD